MKIKTISLKNFKGYIHGKVNFRDFTCLYGPNGIGKTTVLEAISLICSSMDFRVESDPLVSFTDGDSNWVPTVSTEQRLRNYLKKNIRDGQTGFEVDAVFEHDGKDYRVVLNETGFQTNELLGQEFWWPGIVYFAKFDTEMNKFLLPADSWPRFASAFTGITGITVSDPLLWETRPGESIVDGFVLHKPHGKIPFKLCSAGERKIAKALSQIVLFEKSRKPHIVLVDNIEMHVHYKRHMAMMDELKSLFEGMQVVSTTHSTVVMEKYEPREDLVDIELVNVNLGATV